jgi:hypothetical protein
LSEPALTRSGSNAFGVAMKLPQDGEFPAALRCSASAQQGPSRKR